jgi:DNA (cytosine-5)-methyltransferase 1
MSRPRLLDLFCGAGGAAVGYHRAGFDVVGVDLEPQSNYPFQFIRADALAVELDGFDAIHASPPCQAYTALAGPGHPRLLEPVRERLRATGLPYVVENVVGAPLLEPKALLCGSMFGLGVRRHRLFEASFVILAPTCHHSAQLERIRAYYGKKRWAARRPDNNVQGRERLPLLRGTVERAPRDMGIDWMTWDELREAIPPAYTELVGYQLRAQVEALAA